MANDASSGDGHRQPHRGLDRDHTSEDLHAALTQELAKLLAAAIAQKQSGRLGGAPTGADLASLASLVAGAGAQRTLVPVFKDGLSALSYGQHRPAPVPEETVEHFDHMIDDEPMPIPSTWRQPAVHDEDRWFRQQMGAAALGLGAGLLIVVPTVLWLSGWLGGPPKQRPAATTVVAETQPAEINAVKVQVRAVERPTEAAAQFVTGSLDVRLDAVAARPIEQASAAAAAAKSADLIRARVEEMVNAAKRRIESGDVTAARELLADADGSAQGAAWFVLAETYDPNMLAAWGSRGVAADVAKARALYNKAMEVGAARSKARLDALK